MKSSICVAGVAAIFGLACQSPTRDRSVPIDPEIETETEPEILEAPPAPTHAAPGLLGGPCGKNYEKCKTGQAFAKKFMGLKKSNYKVAYCEENDPSGRATVRVDFQIDKLVNDHKGSKDSISVGVDISPNGETLYMDYTRNGMHLYSQTTRGSDVDSRWGENEGVYYGLFELSAAMGDQKIWTKIASAANSCVIGKGANSSRVCINCYLGLFGVSAAIAFAGGAGALAAGGIVGVGIGSITAGVDTVVGNTWSCERACAIGECNVSFGECYEAAGCNFPNDKANCGGHCFSELKTCCKSVGGKCTDFWNRYNRSVPTGTCETCDLPW